MPIKMESSRPSSEASRDSRSTVRIRSDGGSAPRDDVYSPDRQQRPGHPDDP